ncbi:MAG: hypothetical protein MJ180_03040 [Candidatus Gastranaerophilales bacterium]|nr:hypothetical protein [Candidatus Gastranaerophilales bacterium]
MKINSISNQNFGQIYIEPNMRRDLGEEAKTFCEMRGGDATKKFNEITDNANAFQYSDIYLKDSGEIYVYDKIRDKKIPIHSWCLLDSYMICIQVAGAIENTIKSHNASSMRTGRNRTPRRIY